MTPYNTGFPATYPQVGYGAGINPYSLTQQGFSLQNQQTTSSNINWVCGIEGAKSYPVAPGNTVLLMDSESQVFYIKTSDNSGMPMPLRIFPYTEKVTQVPDVIPAQVPPVEVAPQVDLSPYVTRDEINAKIDEVYRLVDELTSSKDNGRKERSNG